MKIKYVKKEKLYPHFGAALFKGEKIFVRKDLPKAAQKFVLEHEKFHIIDYRRLIKEKKKELIVWSEIKASFYGFVRHPVGGILTLILGLNRLPRVIYSYFNKKEYEKEINKLEKNLR